MKFDPSDLDFLVTERDVYEEDERQQAERIFQQALPVAAHAIVQLARAASSERVQFQAAQYIVERNMGRVQDNPIEPMSDPFKELLAECVKEFADIPDGPNVGSN